MKILLLGDYSNYHACLGQALTRMGHSITVASDHGGWMKTSASISLERALPGKAGGMLLFMKMLGDRRLRGYDIVSLINPSFVRLRPDRIRSVFNRLKSSNGAVFLGSVGTDKAVMDLLTSKDCPLRYNEYFSSPGVPYMPNASLLDEDRQWQQNELGALCEFVYDNVDGVTTALYEYHLAMERRIDRDRLSYVGIPIDTHVNLADKDSSSGKINLFLGRHAHRCRFKGTDRIEIAARRVAEEFPQLCTLTIVENIPYHDYLKRLQEADVVLDQLYSYSPATNALQAMMAGKAVVSGAEPEYYDFIGEKTDRPIINIVPDDDKIYHTLRSLVLRPEIIRESQLQGPEFVRRHNDAAVVASRCLEFWTSKI